MIDAIQIVTTTGNREEAERIANELVEHRLAACVQIGGPITSTYRWQGAIESGTEWLCVVKTRRGLLSAVEATIHKLHSYEVPEILAFDVVAGSRGYLDWLVGEVAAPAEDSPQ